MSHHLETGEDPLTPKIEAEYSRVLLRVSTFDCWLKIIIQTVNARSLCTVEVRVMMQEADVYRLLCLISIFIVFFLEEILRSDQVCYVDTSRNT